MLTFCIEIEYNTFNNDLMKMINDTGQHCEPRIEFGKKIPNI